jgi:hypothetical protein
MYAFIIIPPPFMTTVSALGCHCNGYVKFELNYDIKPIIAYDTIKKKSDQRRSLSAINLLLLYNIGIIKVI